MEAPVNRDNPPRIVVTGGPGGGKTTAADLFRRELGDKVVVVPEAGTILFSGGFPRSANPDALKAAQKAIYHTQCEIEVAQAAIYPKRALLCDRGTVDGVAYWPDDGTDFFATVGSSIETELSRYDAVIFFESAAAGGLSIEGGNPVRNESIDLAVALDRRLREAWSRHRDFTFVPHQTSFFKKLSMGLAALESRLAVLNHRRMNGDGNGNGNGNNRG